MFEKMRKFFFKEYNNTKETTESLEKEKTDTLVKSQKERLKLEVEIVTGDRKEEIIKAVLKHRKETEKYSDIKLKDTEEVWNLSRIFYIGDNIYGRIGNLSGELRSYFKYKNGEVEPYFLPYKNIPPFEGFDEEYEKQYKDAHPDFKEKKAVMVEWWRRKYIALHNGILRREGYNYLIDDKGIYRLFKLSEGNAKKGGGISGIRYDSKYGEDMTIIGYKKVSVTEYGQEIPKESEEYYEVMQKLRGKTEDKQ